MNNIVNPAISTGVPAPSIQPRPTATGDAGAAAGQAATPLPRDDDSVQLTESARAMDVAARSTDVPVDAARVAQLRAAIADGTYQIDPQRIAARLISMEKQLG